MYINKNKYYQRESGAGLFLFFNRRGESVAVQKFLPSFFQKAGVNRIFTLYFKKRHLKIKDIMVEFISLAL